MNSILNEVNECVEILNKKQISKNDIVNSLMKAARTVDKFFIKNNISDEEIAKAVERGNRNVK